MKRKLFRKNLYSFSRQGLAENLLPVFKEFKKKLAKNPLSSHFQVDGGVKGKLERNFSADTSHNIRSKLPHYPMIRSKRMQRGKARLFSQFFNKQNPSFSFPNVSSLSSPISTAMEKTRAAKSGILQKIDARQSCLALSLACSKKLNTSVNWEKLLQRASISDKVNLLGTKFSDTKVVQKRLDSFSNGDFSGISSSGVNLLLSAEQVKTEIQSAFSKTRQKKEYSPFLIQIHEKKKLRYLYGNLSASQLKKIAVKAQQLPGTTADNLVILLESRIDSVCQRCHFFSTIKAARQYITHKGVWINSQLVTTPSYQLSPGDVICLIDPKKVSSSLLYSNFNFNFNLKNWKKMSESSENVQGNNQHKNALYDGSGTNLRDSSAMHNERCADKSNHNLEMQEQLNIGSQVSNISQTKESFLNFVKNQGENNLSVLNVSALQIVASQLVYKNKLSWDTALCKNYSLTPFISAEKSQDGTNFSKIYKKWILFLLAISAITNSSDSLFNNLKVLKISPFESPTAKRSNAQQFDRIALFLENLNCSNFVATIVDKLPDYFQQSASKTRISSQGIGFSTINAIKQNNNQSQTQENNISQLENIYRKSVLDSSSKEKKEDTINFFLQKREMFLRNNSLKKIFFDFACLTPLQIESLFFSSQIQSNLFNNLQLDLKNKAGMSSLLQFFFNATDFEDKSVNLVTKKQRSSKNLASKKFFSWGQKLSTTLFKQMQKKMVEFSSTSSSSSSSNKFDSIYFSSYFSNYIFFVFLLHMQSRFIKLASKKREKTAINNSISPVNEFSTTIEKIQKDSALFQKRSKALHVEVSYQSLSAIFLFPPQKVYFNAIINSHIILKSLLK